MLKYLALTLCLTAGTAGAQQALTCDPQPTDNEFILTFKPPPDEGAIITGYVAYRGARAGEWVGVPVSPVPTLGGLLAARLGGLANDRQWVVAVAAKSADGKESPPSGEITIPPLLCSVPGAPTDLALSTEPLPVPPTPWPSAATTGPAASVTLVNCPAGVITSSKTGCRFNGAIQIGANNVTIRDSVVISQPGASYAISDGGSPRTGTVLERVRVSGALDGKCVYLSNAPWTGDRLDVSGCTDGIFGGQATVTNSWIHDVATGGPRHSDGYQTAGGANVTLRGNNIEVVKGAANSAIFISANPGAVNNMLIEGNRLAGGTYIVYCGAQGGPVPTNVRFRSNTFVRNSSSFGVASVQCQTGAGWEWTGNKFDDGAAIPQP